MPSTRRPWPHRVGCVPRYARPFDDRWLPKGKEECRQEAHKVGAYGFELLAALREGDAPAWLKELPAIETMRVVWLQNYLLTPEGLNWRTNEHGLPPTAKRLASPTDPHSRGSRRGEISWGGYKLHLTETCDEGAPRIVTHIQTDPAPEQDAGTLSPTHKALAAKELLPALQLVDGAYMESQGPFLRLTSASA